MFNMSFAVSNQDGIFLPVRGDLVKIHKLCPELKKQGYDLAKKRRDFHAGYGSTRHWYDPKKGEYTDEYYGCIGEMIFMQTMQAKNLGSDAEFPPLFSEDPKNLPDWDARIKGKTFEIKTIPPDDPDTRRVRMLVKLSECKENIDYYLAIKFIDEDHYIYCGYITGKELVKIRPQKFRFSVSYAVFLKDLKRVSF